MRPPSEESEEAKEWWFRATLGGPFPAETYTDPDGNTEDRVPPIWSRSMPRRAVASRAERMLLDARACILARTGEYALYLVNRQLRRGGIDTRNRYW
jgi:hypothetical protein